MKIDINEIRYHRGRAKLSKGDREGAVKDFDAVIGDDKKYAAEAYFYRGRIMAMQMNFAAAITNFAEAEKRELRSAELYFYRGNVKGHMEQYQAAIADYDKTITINPQHADAYNNRGIAKGQFGRPHCRRCGF